MSGQSSPKGSDTSLTPSRRVVLSGSLAATGAAALAVSPSADAAEIRPGAPGTGWPGRPLRPQPPAAELPAVLREIRPARVEATVRRLVAFRTRHTLSSQTDPQHGIGAARDWLCAELSRPAPRSGGRMTVNLQSYVQPPASRIPTPTRITNVM